MRRDIETLTCSPVLFFDAEEEVAVRDLTATAPAPHFPTPDSADWLSEFQAVTVVSARPICLSLPNPTSIV